MSSRYPDCTERYLLAASLGFALLLPFVSWYQLMGGLLLAVFTAALILPFACSAKAEGVTPGEATSSPLGHHLRKGAPFLLLPLVYRYHMHVAAAVWTLAAVGGLTASRRALWAGPRLFYNPARRWSGWTAFVLTGTLAAYAVTRWTAPWLPPAKVWWLSLDAAALAATIETLPNVPENPALLAAVTSGFLFCISLVEPAALHSNLPYLKLRVVLAIAANGPLAVLAWRMGLADRSGAAAGFVLGLAVYMGYGYKSFLLLVVFFLLGSVATRLGYATKVQRGVAEPRHGARSWREAVANVLPGAFFALLVITTPHERAFLLALVAAFAEAAADTVSSEIGQWLSPRAWLLTSGAPVAAGQHGAVSLPGSLAGVLAATTIAGLGYALRLCSLRGATLALLAALAGNLADSVLGATLERRGQLTNGVVNFVSSSLAGGLALAMSL